MLVQGKYLYYGDDTSVAFEIRKNVFHDELGSPLGEVFDEFDDLSVHVIVFATEGTNEAVATGRVYFDGDDYHIQKIAVLKKERGKQYGDFVVRMLANKAFLAGALEILICAQVSTIPFYEKIGFNSYGDEYEKSGAKYVSMKLVSGNLCKKCTTLDAN